MLSADASYVSAAVLDVWPRLGVRAAAWEGETAWLLRFGTADDPVAEPVPLVEAQNAGAALYGVALDAACVPETERCSGADEDCDGVVDGGRCCAAQVHEIELMLPEGADAPTEFMATRTENGAAVRILGRVAEDRWLGWLSRLPPPREPALPVQRNAVPIAGLCESVDLGRCPDIGGVPFVCAPSETQPAHEVCTDPEGRQFTAFDLIGPRAGFRTLSTGGSTAVLAEDADGVVTLWWYHSQAGAVNAPHRRDGVKPPATVPCGRVLAAETANHNTFDESILVVCEDRVLRLYSVPGVEDEMYLFEELEGDADGVRIARAEWATITPSSPQLLRLAIGHRHEEAWRVSSLAHLTQARGAPSSVPVPRELQGLDEGDAAEPLFLQTSIAQGSLLVRVARNGEVGVRQREPDAQMAWHRVVATSSPDRVVVSRVAERMVIGAPAGDRYGLWVLPLDAPQPDGWWQTQPTLLLDTPPLGWFLLDAPQESPLGVIERDPDGAVVVRMYQLTCNHR